MASNELCANDDGSRSSSPGFSDHSRRSCNRQRSRSRGVRANHQAPKCKPMPIARGSIGRLLASTAAPLRSLPVLKEAPVISIKPPPPQYAGPSRSAPSPMSLQGPPRRKAPAPPAAAPPPRRPEPPDLNGYTLPRVAVFDLDETCWDHLGLDLQRYRFSPPFTWSAAHETVIDSKGQRVLVFRELRAVLMGLYQAGVVLAVASHDQRPEWCREVMHAYVLDSELGLTWGDITDEELVVIRSDGEYWTNKSLHLRDICKHLHQCRFQDLLFFDDNKNICKQAASLGVTAVQVKGGISLTHLYEGLKEHKRHHSPGYGFR
mmetsp:Transcript_23440/g.54132  ORF Transcript_23440/g.54132 Transcript_23440/m.54132 type:complete len:319 (+) Transcript_23440:68-1024(+)